MIDEFIKQMEDEGYSHLKFIQGKGYYGLRRMIFTTGLFCQLDPISYSGRYCYETFNEAKEALQDWDGIGYPSGNWIKYKGVEGEISKV